MIAINQPVANEDHGKFYKLSRNSQDQNQVYSSLPSDHLPFANRNITNPQTVECTQKNDFHLCDITDAYKQHIIVDRVNFLNIQVQNPMITTYKPPQSPTSITRIDFTKQHVICEVTGLHDTGYMIKCYNDQNQQNSFFN